jgi:hypothetical protein
MFAITARGFAVGTHRCHFAVGMSATATGHGVAARATADDG